MLVLSRKQGERIMINDDVEIVVIQAGGKNIRLGFRAPQSVRIRNREVYVKEMKENSVTIEKMREVQETMSQQEISAQSMEMSQKMVYGKVRVEKQDFKNESDFVRATREAVNDALDGMCKRAAIEEWGTNENE